MLPLIEIGLKLLDKVIPDPQAKAQAQLELLKLEQAGEFEAIRSALQSSQMQTEVNKVEAASTDRFVAGWRPFIGWVCGSALAWHFIGRPIAVWVAALVGATTEIPAVEMDDLIVILLGMLGLGAYRSAEKIKGAA